MRSRCYFCLHKLSVLNQTHNTWYLCLWRLQGEWLAYPLSKDQPAASSTPFHEGIHQRCEELFVSNATAPSNCRNLIGVELVRMQTGEGLWKVLVLGQKLHYAVPGHSLRCQEKHQGSSQGEDVHSLRKSWSWLSVEPMLPSYSWAPCWHASSLLLLLQKPSQQDHWLGTGILKVDGVPAASISVRKALSWAVTFLAYSAVYVLGHAISEATIIISWLSRRGSLDEVGFDDSFFSPRRILPLPRQPTRPCMAPLLTRKIWAGALKTFLEFPSQLSFFLSLSLSLSLFLSVHTLFMIVFFTHHTHSVRSLITNSAFSLAWNSHGPNSFSLAFIFTTNALKKTWVSSSSLANLCHLRASTAAWALGLSQVVRPRVGPPSFGAPAAEGAPCLSTGKAEVLLWVFLEWLADVWFPSEWLDTLWDSSWKEVSGQSHSVRFTGRFKKTHVNRNAIWGDWMHLVGKCWERQTPMIDNDQHIVGIGSTIIL